MKMIENTSPVRGKGVTILMGSQILTTQPPVKEDAVFLQTALYWSHEFRKGQPRG